MTLIFPAAGATTTPALAETAPIAAAATLAACMNPRRDTSDMIKHPVSETKMDTKQSESPTSRIRHDPVTAYHP
jgi:hypothetical protein